MISKGVREIFEGKYTESIKGHMKQLVTSHIKNDDLQMLLLSFLEAKQQMNFGRLTIVHHQTFGGKDPEIFHLSAAVELLVLSFDIFDDLEDLDNPKEPWMKIDPAIALNAATALYTLSQHTVTTLVTSNKHQILQTFLSYSIQAMDGQHDDLQHNAQTEDEMLHLMRRKSGSLIALSTVTGVQLAGIYCPDVEEYSYQIGIAAQIDNDFRGLFNQEKLSATKTKSSLALLYLQKRYNEHASDLLAFYDSNKTIIEEFGSVKHYKQKLKNAGVLQYLNVMKQLSLNRAKRIIDKLDLNPDRIETLKSQLIINENPTNKE